jgi:hypothetical protein
LPKRLAGKSSEEIEKYLSLSNEMLNFALDLISGSGTRVIKVDNNSDEIDKGKILNQLESKTDVIVSALK